MSEMLIDLKGNPGWPVALQKVFSSARVAARRFMVDHDTMERAYALAHENLDLYESMRQFAKAPFPHCYLESDASSTVGVPDARFGFIVTDRWFYEIQPSDRPGYVMINRMAYDRARGTTEEVWQPDSANTAQERAELRRSVTRGHRMIETLFLLMHAPRGVQITEKPAHRKLVKGKQKAYAAHSVITIDLSAKEARRVIADGSRGPIRAHEVRGHWMHLHRVRGCSHEWRAVPVEPDRPERWVCDCGTVRVWRKPHQKGDATLGYVTHQYHVTHGDRA